MEDFIEHIDFALAHLMQRTSTYRPNGSDRLPKPKHPLILRSSTCVLSHLWSPRFAGKSRPPFAANASRKPAAVRGELKATVCGEVQPAIREEIQAAVRSLHRPAAVRSPSKPTAQPTQPCGAHRGCNWAHLGYPTGTQLILSSVSMVALHVLAQMG